MKGEIAGEVVVQPQGRGLDANLKCARVVHGHVSAAVAADAPLTFTLHLPATADFAVRRKKKWRKTSKKCRLRAAAAAHTHTHTRVHAF
jgi:hypothetical protein